MISVIIPVYNVEQYILRCLESVACQTYKGDVECVIVDDCGSDCSIELAKTFINSNRSHVSFRIIRHEHNRGLAAARNTGVECSNGSFVIHLDSDDWLSHDAIELLVNKQRETNADIVSGNAIAHYDGFDKILAEPDYENSMDMVYKTIQMTLDHVIWRRLIRKSLYVDNCIKAEEGVNIGEDHHTLPRLAYYAKSIAKVDAVIYHYNCMNPNSYMQSSKERISQKRYRNDIRSIQILKDFFSGIEPIIVKELDSIEKKFEQSMRYWAVSSGDRIGYRFLCEEQGLPAEYYKYRIRYIITERVYLIKALLNKLFSRFKKKNIS